MIIALSSSMIYASEPSPSSDVNVYVDMDSVVDELVKIQEQIAEIQTEIDDNEQYLISVSKYMILSFFVISITAGYYIGYSLAKTKIGR
jgi:hypothetical protein